jgi:hypothetical protein
MTPQKESESVIKQTARAMAQSKKPQSEEIKLEVK